jgi:hypothetical protein
MTLAFGTFPSIRRYSAEVPASKSALAVDSFLGSPILFYAHEGYFAEGIDQFDSVADLVNQLQPDTSWLGLGSILQHLYLERSRDDGNYDIEAFTGSLQLENVHREDAVFYVEKDETFQYRLELFVDGQPHSYSRKGNRIRLEVPIRAGMSRQLSMRYEDDLNLSIVDISKPSLRIAALRYLSEFRDNEVSQSSLGRTFIKVYTRHRSSLNQGSALLFLFLVLTGVVFASRAKRGAPLASNDSRATPPGSPN